MGGLTISTGQKFLETGNLDQKSLRIEGGSQFETKGPSAATSAKSFADTLQEAVGKVNEMQITADKKMQDLATGRTDNVADVMIATERADIALKLMMQVRNKIIDAYQEVMKMQV